MKTTELIGPALDWAVAKAMGPKVGLVNTRRGPEPCIWVDSYEGDVDLPVPAYSTDWAQGGPIIDEGKISIYTDVTGAIAQQRLCVEDGTRSRRVQWYWGSGPTPLVAAMRCFVASKLGDEVELPEELT